MTQTHPKTLRGFSEKVKFEVIFENFQVPLNNPKSALKELNAPTAQANSSQGGCSQGGGWHEAMVLSLGKGCTIEAEGICRLVLPNVRSTGGGVRKNTSNPQTRKIDKKKVRGLKMWRGVNFSILMS